MISIKILIGYQKCKLFHLSLVGGAITFYTYNVMQGHQCTGAIDFKELIAQNASPFFLSCKIVICRIYIKLCTILTGEKDLMKLKSC